MRAVCGNIDGNELKLRYSKILRFKIEDCNVMMTHIGGYPGKYSPEVRQYIYKEKPDLMVAGHSHILKVIHDPLIDCLHINPGAAGKQGWHQVRTLIKLTINGKQIKELEVIELND